VVFGAELLPANVNRGPDLLRSNAIQGVIVYLDRLHELGVEGVTIAISYASYLPSFPNYQEYVAFYKLVMQEARPRGMKVNVEAGVIFSGTAFANINISYVGLTWTRYVHEKECMVATIVRDLAPDYLNLGAEPDTEFALLRLEELKSPQKYTEYINYVLEGLDRGRTKIGAGIGTWGNIEHIKSFASSTDLEFIAMHVYPTNGEFLQRIQTIAEIAREYNKSLILDEAWLYKTDAITSSVAASVDVFRRDAISFWAPLDQQLLSVIVRSARPYNIEYISPFCTTFFFSYIEYDTSTANLPYDESTGLVNRRAAENILVGKFTTTGEFYGRLIRENT